MLAICTGSHLLQFTVYHISSMTFYDILIFSTAFLWILATCRQE